MASPPQLSQISTGRFRVLLRVLERSLQHPPSPESYSSPQFSHISTDLFRFSTTGPVGGADLRAALEASCKRGFLPSVDFSGRKSVSIPSSLFLFLAYGLFSVLGEGEALGDWSSNFASLRASDDFAHISLRALRSCVGVAAVIALRSEASKISGAGLGDGEVALGSCAILGRRSSGKLSECFI